MHATHATSRPSIFRSERGLRHTSFLVKKTQTRRHRFGLFYERYNLVAQPHCPQLTHVSVTATTAARVLKARSFNSSYYFGSRLRAFTWIKLSPL